MSLFLIAVVSFVSFILNVVFIFVCFEGQWLFNFFMITAKRKFMYTLDVTFF